MAETGREKGIPMMRTLRIALVCSLLAAWTGLGAAEEAAPPATPPPQPGSAATKPGETPPPAAAPADSEAKRAADQQRMKEVLATPTPVSPFTETTTVLGDTPAGLRGVWLLVVHAEMNRQAAPGKVRSFVQLFKVADGANAKPEVHILDLVLPAAITQSVEQTNTTLRPWQPTAEQLQLLRTTWSTLPPYKEKNLTEHLINSMEYTVSDPPHYATAIGEQEAPKEILEGSNVALRVVERYLPGRVPPDSPVHISQVMGRTSIYGLTVDGQVKDHLEGRALVGFIAAGAGSPLPYNFPGRVIMYRLAQ
jgi:hypothetical protein